MITLINHQGLKTVSGIQIQTPAPSIGLAYIGAFLKLHGYSYKAIDACGEGLEQIRSYNNLSDVVVQGLTIDEVIARIPKNTKIIGFSCLFSHCWPLVLDMAKAVRRVHPYAMLIVGGEHPTAMPHQSLDNEFFDVAVLGEGEETFLELIKKMNHKDAVKGILGIAYKDNKNNIVINPPRARITDIDNFPYPDWDSWFIENYISHNQVTGINHGRSIPILASRGCPYVCTFCSSPKMWTRRYVFRDSKKLVDEMEFFKEKYNLVGFAFMDLTFIVNRKKILGFAEELIVRKLGVSYQLPAGTRCEAIDDELVYALEKSGLKNFALAPESGDESILIAIKKQIKIPRFYQAVRSVLKSNITVGCFVVIGFPEDSQYSMRKTLKLVRRLAWLGTHDLTVSQFTPYPGSEYFDQLVKKNKISDDFRNLENIIDFYSNSNDSYSDYLSAKNIYNWMIYLYLNFYIISFLIRPWRVVYNFWIYFSTGVERTRYMRFFSDFFINRKFWKSV